MQPIDVILKKIVELKPGDLVTVVWHDACAFSRIDRLTPEIFATIKETVGRFIGLLTEPKTGYKYLVLSYEETDGKPTEGTSIPLGCVESITTRVERKWKNPLKARKDQPDRLKIIEHFKKVVIYVE